MSAANSPTGDPREPDRSFHSALMKARWSEHDLARLLRNIAPVLDSYRQQALQGLYAKDGRVVVQNNQIPAWVAIDAGNIVFNCRSALDCCWMGLLRAREGLRAKGTLPRAEGRDGVEGTLREVAIEQTFPGTDELILDKIRPYRDGSETLWFVAQVDNWNKHNMLLLNAQRSVLNAAMTFNRPGGGKAHVLIENDQSIGPGSFPMLSGVGTPENHYANVTVDIVLQSWKPVDERPLVPFLHSAVKETIKAVELFITTFGKKTPELLKG